MLKWIRSHHCVLLLTGMILYALFTPNSADAAHAKLTWRPNTSGVNTYLVFKRQQGQDYNFKKPVWKGTGKSCVVNNLEENKTYFFVIRACKDKKQSDNSNEVCFKANPKSSSPTKGSDDNASAEPTDDSRDSGSPANQPKPDTHNNGDFLKRLEFGDARINHHWTRIRFSKSFYHPIVVAGPLSNKDGQPSVVRIRNINTQGFDMRIQEWDYLNGRHAFETVSYIVIEQGNYTLSDGTRIEADSLSLKTEAKFKTVRFNREFTVPPVVMSATTSFDDKQTVTRRIRNIKTKGFQCLMQRQESKPRRHGAEMFSYIAWEPCSGSIGNISYLVKRTPKKITHKFFNIFFDNPFKSAPSLISDMQTTNGFDPANLRYANKDRFSVDVWIDEEQSRDLETIHVKEVVGMMVLGRK